MGICDEGLPCCRKDFQRRRHESTPLWRCEEENDINHASQQPAIQRPKVPVATETQIVAAGQRCPRRDRFDFILCSPGGIFGELFPGEANPFASRQCVVAPVKLWVRTDDFDPAANEQRREKEGEEVGQANPEGKSELKGIIHNAKPPVGRYLSHMLAAADGACEAPAVVSPKAVVVSRCRGACRTRRQSAWLQLTPKQMPLHPRLRLDMTKSM